MSEDVRTHTAVHVVKGAVQKVLGARWTASVYVSGRHGRLTVSCDRRPTEQEVAAIEQEANRKVSEGAEVLEFEMDREEAEGHFGDQIYDLFPVPSNVTRLRIVRIPEWNINCCNERHLENTAQIGRIRLEAPRYRNSRKELECGFDVG